MGELTELFFVFAKIGICTFGGGYAMLPMLTRELVERKKWVTQDDLADYFAIGQCTPGVIAVNTATFVGYKQKRYAGGVVATLGVIFPTTVLIAVVSTILTNFVDIPQVISAFTGIRAVVCGLILSATWKMAKGSIVDVFSGAIFAAGVVANMLFGVSPVMMVLATGIAGVVRTGVAAK
jgi:Chromate transport protein ChrA